MKVNACTVCEGKAEGEAVVCNGSFSFLGDLNPSTGEISIPGHKLEGKSVADKVLIFTYGKGSSGGPRIAWLAKRNGMAPSAMICLESEPVMSCSVIAANIPTVHKPEKNIFNLINAGDYVRVDATAGIIEIIKKNSS